MVHNARSSQDITDRLSQFYPFDGLIDLFAGFGLVMAGLFTWAGMFWLAGIYPAIFFPAWQSAKKQITAPRMSQVHLDSGQRQRLVRAGMMWMGILVLLVLIGAALFVAISDGVLAASSRTWLSEYIPLILGFGSALLIALTALVGRMPHWFLNALAVALLTAIGFWQGWAGWLVIVLIGSVFLLTGSVLLVQFLHDNPLPRAKA